ncbi:Pseudouridine synthase [Pseudomonas sp. OF001]|uniref:hypothetical protein n=1 Tax=Pseudomonas sp. OF001 TaxID=2772300 RepID=UPI001917F56B|nr:hypothetical protein [Pseudomonas sp. OF001]CAD5377374.1 Pseudouridine synthase [Pseudomonas sp. OF001]
MKQSLIAVDQFVNTLVWAAGEGFGLADETLSARAWRLRERKSWGLARRLIDLVFFWEVDHCEDSFRVEQARRHLPPTYRAKTAD